MASRRTQPYRKGTGRMAGPALDAMRRGRSAHSAHPHQPMRTAAKNARKRKKKKRSLYDALSIRRTRNTSRA